jgi:hypothetical protein
MQNLNFHSKIFVLVKVTLYVSYDSDNKQRLFT